MFTKSSCASYVSGLMKYWNIKVDIYEERIWEFSKEKVIYNHEKSTH